MNSDMSGFVAVLTLATALGAGLIAGAFFAFSSFIMAALRRVPAPEGTRAMQEINVTVINPEFMTALLGTAVACVVVVIAALVDWDGSYGPWLLAGAALYVAGCVGVTIACNVPRNNALARVAAGSAEATEVWHRYAVEWTRWNSVRTIAALAATGCFIGGIAAG